jgi:hypothetical protein
MLRHYLRNFPSSNMLQTRPNKCVYILLVSLKQCLPNIFARRSLMASKSNHGSSQSCSRKYGVCGWEVSKIKNFYLRTDFRHLRMHGGTRWRSCLRHCAKNRKVAGLIPDGVIWIFHWHNPSGRTMALRSTQPQIEISTRNISWGVKAAGA